jgi:hypothetical protein
MQLCEYLYMTSKQAGKQIVKDKNNRNGDKRDIRVCISVVPSFWEEVVSMLERFGAKN